VPTPLTGLDPANPPPTRIAPTPTPTPMTAPKSGGLLGGLLGGGS